MTLPSNKHFYKVISLFIKSSIFILSIWYIIQKLTDADITWDFSDLLSKTTSPYFLTALFLVSVNWGIEAIKWKYMIRKMEEISYSTAIKSILSGVTISIFTPNRVGEFAGRVFYLKNADKVKATLISLLGSLIQLSITIIAGCIAGIIYYSKANNAKAFSIIFKSNVLLICSVIVIGLAAIVVVYYIRNSFSKKTKDAFSILNLKENSIVFLLSFMRYLVFSFQYYLVLQIFGIDAGLVNSLVLIALTFFMTSAIPTFALSEIAVRGLASVYFFSTITSDVVAIITASITLWIINLAIPALIGGMFIWDLKFFKD